MLYSSQLEAVEIHQSWNLHMTCSEEDLLSDHNEYKTALGYLLDYSINQHDFLEWKNYKTDRFVRNKETIYFFLLSHLQAAIGFL